MNRGLIKKPNIDNQDIQKDIDNIEKNFYNKKFQKSLEVIKKIRETHNNQNDIEIDKINFYLEYWEAKSLY